MCEISPVFKQFVAIACCNLLTLTCGLTSGWATINFNEFQSVNTTSPIGPLTLEESSLVVSIENIGGLVGNFAVLPFNHFGIKRIIHLLGLPLIASSLLIIWAQNVYLWYLSRFLEGFSCGAAIIAIPSLISKISYTNVRGALNSLFDPLYNIGIISSFFLGNYLNSLDQAKAQLVVPAIFMVLMFVFPETPEFWTNKNKTNRALKSRKFYKGEPENTQFLSGGEVEKGVADSNESSPKLTLQDFLTPHAKKAFLFAISSIVLGFLSGAFVILSYVTDIFTKTGSSLTPNNSSILISVTQIFANLCFLNIVERFNRRTLFIGSSILTAIFFFIFGAYCSLWLKNPAYEWIPPFCFASIVFFSCMGLIPIPYIIATEIFPPKILSAGLAVVASFMWILFFIVGFILPMFMEYFGLSICMTTLGVMCLVNLFFGIYFIPETRGKTFEEITEMMSK